MNARPDDLENLMREKLGDFQQEPPEGVWDNILAGLPGPSKRPVPVIWWRKLGIPLAASLVLIATGLWLGRTFIANETSAPAARPADPAALSPRQANAAAPADQSIAPITHLKHQESNQQTTSAERIHPSSTAPKQTVAVQHPQRPVVMNTEESFTLASTTNPSPTGSSRFQTARAASINPINTLDVQFTPATPDGLSFLTSRQTRKLSRRWQYARPLHYFVGLNYTPGWLVQRNENEFTQGLALSAGLEIHHLIIETGLGVDFQKTQNMALVTYLTNDSIFHKENQTATTRYTLLNIPVMLGYRWNIHNWALTLKGGGIYHVQVRKHQNELLPSSENVLSYNVFDRTQTRSNAWISLWAATEAEYYVHEKLSLSLQPWFRYALLDVNTNKSTTRLDQHAAGINAGLKVHL